MSACATPRRAAFVAPLAAAALRWRPPGASTLLHLHPRRAPLSRRQPVARTGTTGASGAASRRPRVHKYCMDTPPDDIGAPGSGDVGGVGGGGGGGEGGGGGGGGGGGRRSSSSSSSDTGPLGGGKYQPGPDDRAELASETPSSLTLAQQLLLKQYAEQVDRMSDDEARTLAIEVARQMMVKDNIMRMLTGRDMPSEYQIQPPDPEAPIDDDDINSGGLADLGGGKRP